MDAIKTATTNEHLGGIRDTLLHTTKRMLKSSPYLFATTRERQYVVRFYTDGVMEDLFNHRFEKIRPLIIGAFHQALTEINDTIYLCHKERAYAYSILSNDRYPPLGKMRIFARVAIKNFTRQAEQARSIHQDLLINLNWFKNFSAQEI